MTDTTYTKEQIRAMLGSITQGEWYVGAGDPDKQNAVALVRGLEVWGNYGAVSCWTDAQFIAAAPAIVRQLLDEIERLKGGS